MKTIGLIGGMSWESTAVYYDLVNRFVKERLGGFHSAACVLYSFDFFEIERLQRTDGWDELDRLMVGAASRLKNAGADFLVICANTMHRSAPVVERETGMEVLHIADAAGREVVKQGLARVGLLGTKFTMEGDFYRGLLKERFGLDVMIPGEADRAFVHGVIYDELCMGILKDESRAAFIGVVNSLKERGAQGVVLGCTEIPLLMGQDDVDIPVFDTTRIHAAAAVEKACG